MTTHNSQQGGFILILVVMTISLLAAIAYLMNSQNAMYINSLGKEIEETEARYVAMSGVSHLLWQSNKANCTGYSNLTNVPFGTNSYSATISPTSGSPVSIKVVGTHANGASYTIQRDRVPVYQNPTTLVLQPDAGAGKDTYLYQWKATWNYGLATDLAADNKFANSEYRSLLHFDLSGLPAKAAIKTAKLELYQNTPSATGGEVTVYGVSRSWTEGIKSGGVGAPNWTQSDTAVNWTNAGGDYAGTSVAKTTIPSGVQAWYAWDVSSLVQNWAVGTLPNYGFMLAATPGVSSWYYSSDYTNPALRPKLTITYACECGQTCDTTPCTPKQFKDSFQSVSYAGSDGTDLWTNDWQETGETDGPTTGKLSVLSASQCVSGNCLKIRHDTATVMRITREANLATAVSASLNFNYRRNIPGSAGGAITLEISKNGGSTFSLLKTYQLDTIDSAPIAESIDISPYLAANTQIRFSTNGSNFQTNIHIDDVDISTACVPDSGLTTVTLNPTADTYLAENSTGTNYGTDSTVKIGWNNTGKAFKGLIKFDISSLPVGATVTSATLRLNETSSAGSGSFNVGIYKIIATWSEATATWANMSGAGNYNATQLAVTSVSAGLTGFVQWTLPVGLINEWTDSVPGPNYGLALVYENTTKGLGAGFASKEDATAASRPQLVITYTP